MLDSKATDVKLWKLLYRQPLPSWHTKRLVLIGDAAHPMLPRTSTLFQPPEWEMPDYLTLAHPLLFSDQGQGGAQSIEDGAALGILLSRMPRPDVSSAMSSSTAAAALDALIARRLRAFESVRRNRASVMQIYSNAGQDEADKVQDDVARFLGPKVTVPANPAAFHDFNFGHDVVKESEAVLKHEAVLRSRL